MSTRARQHVADVLGRTRLTEHLVRLTLGGPGLAGFESTHVPDEWVGLAPPGQFQSRYYTVRDWDGEVLTLDVVVHEQGLVTEWVARDIVGEQCVVTEPKGSFAMPADSEWLILVADLTALPAVARITEMLPRLPHPPELRVYAEVPDDLTGYLTAVDAAHVTWLESTATGSGLAQVVQGLEWPRGDGYFWMGGESAQMRAIRRFLMRERRLPAARYHVMGYWRDVARRQPRAVDPGPIWRAGKAAGRSDEQIWAEYDAARDLE